jgi:hypothetical protein
VFSLPDFSLFPVTNPVSFFFCHPEHVVAGGFTAKPIKVKTVTFFILRDL